MSTLGAQLARHVDQPEDRHRLVLLAPLSLRCLDCCHTLDLRPATAPVGSTSTSKTSHSTTRQPPRPDDPDQCPEHIGEWAGSCRACRAEQLADETRTRPAPTASTEAMAAAKAEVARVLAARKTRTTTTEESA